MHGDEWYRDNKHFAAGGFWLRKSWPLFKFMMKSMFKKVPLTKVEQLKVEFDQPTDMTIQAEGELEKLAQVKQIKITKGPKIVVI